MLIWRGSTIWPGRFWPTAASMRRPRRRSSTAGCSPGCSGALPRPRRPWRTSRPGGRCRAPFTCSSTTCAGTRGGAARTSCVPCSSAWVRMMSPFTPHVCEELWAAGLGEGYASLADWPVADAALIDRAGGEGGGPAGADAQGRAGDRERHQGHAHEDHALHRSCLEEGDAAPGRGRRPQGGKLDMGALMKQAMATPGHCGAQEGCAQVCPEAGQGGALALGGGAGAGRVRDARPGRRRTCRRRWACRWRSTRRTRRGRTPRARASRRNRGGRRFILSEASGSFFSFYFQLE